MARAGGVSSGFFSCWQVIVFALSSGLSRGSIVRLRCCYGAFRFRVLLRRSVWRGSVRFIGFDVGLLRMVIRALDKVWVICLS